MLVKDGIQLLNYLWKSWEVCEAKDTRTDIKTICVKFRFDDRKAYRLIKTLRKWNIVDCFTRIDAETNHKIKLYYIVSDTGNKLMKFISAMGNVFPKPPIRFNRAPVIEYKKVKDLPIDILFE